MSMIDNPNVQKLLENALRMIVESGNGGSMLINELGEITIDFYANLNRESKVNPGDIYNKQKLDRAYLDESSKFIDAAAIAKHLAKASNKDECCCKQPCPSCNMEVPKK